MMAGHEETGFKKAFDPAEIYDNPVEGMTVKGVFGYVGIDVIPLQIKCDRCGGGIAMGGSWFSAYGAERYCSETCLIMAGAATPRTYSIITLGDLIQRAQYYNREGRNVRT